MVLLWVLDLYLKDNKNMFFMCFVYIKNWKEMYYEIWIYKDKNIFS
jgi:hypothetical protein